MRSLFQPWSAEKEFQRWPFRASATLTLPGRAPARKDLFTSLQILADDADLHISAFFRWKALTGYPYGVEISDSSGQHVLTGLTTGTETFMDELSLQFVMADEAAAILEAGTFYGIPHKGTPCGVGQFSALAFSELMIPQDGKLLADRAAFPIDPSCVFVAPPNLVVSAAGKRLTGVPWLVAGPGVIFEHVFEDGSEPTNEVRVHMQGSSDSERRRASCEEAGVPVPENEVLPYPLRSINGVAPDAWGRLGLRLLTPGEGGTIGTALRLRRTGDGLQFFLAGKAK